MNENARLNGYLAHVLNAASPIEEYTEYNQNDAP